MKVYDVNILNSHGSRDEMACGIMRTEAHGQQETIPSILRSRIWLAIETRGRKFPPLFANFSRVFFFFFFACHTGTVRQNARDYSFIFLGNLPCRFYEHPATANASSSRAQTTVILVDGVSLRTRYRYRAVATVRLRRFLPFPFTSLFCFRLLCRAPRVAIETIDVVNSCRLLSRCALSLRSFRPALSLIFPAHAFLFIEWCFVES